MPGYHFRGLCVKDEGTTGARIVECDEGVFSLPGLTER